jgi:hypothetical protein
MDTGSGTLLLKKLNILFVPFGRTTRYRRLYFFKRIGSRDDIFLKACNIKCGPTYGFKFVDVYLLKKSKFFMLMCNHLLILIIVFKVSGHLFAFKIIRSGWFWIFVMGLVM